MAYCESEISHSLRTYYLGGIINTISISEERDEIHAKFSSAILEMQQKSGLKYMILEKKITAMREELDIKEAQVCLYFSFSYYKYRL